MIKLKSLLPTNLLLESKINTDFEEGDIVDALVDFPYSTTKVQVKILTPTPVLKEHMNTLWLVEYPKGYLNLLLHDSDDDSLTTDHDVSMAEILNISYNHLLLLAKKYKLKLESELSSDQNLFEAIETTDFEEDDIVDAMPDSSPWGSWNIVKVRIITPKPVKINDYGIYDYPVKKWLVEYPTGYLSVLYHHPELAKNFLLVAEDSPEDNLNISRNHMSKIATKYNLRIR